MIYLRSLLCQGTFYAWTVVLCLCYVPLLLGPRRWVALAARFWATSSFAIIRATAGLDYELRGMELLPAGPAVIASKHQSMWDTMIFHVVVNDPAFILKKELWSIPFFGWYLRKSGTIAVDRSGGARALKGMVEDARRALAEGRQVIIFPEGTRTAPGASQPYHPGVAMLADLGAPVIPVALNSGLYWRRREFLRYPGTVILELLPAMPGGLRRREFLCELQARIEAGCRRLQPHAPADNPAGVDKPVDNAGSANSNLA